MVSLELPSKYLHHASFSINMLGVLVIIFGVLCGVVRFLRSEIASARGANAEGQRQRLGYHLLLGPPIRRTTVRQTRLRFSHCPSCMTGAG